MAEQVGADVASLGSAGAKTMAVVRGDADAYVHSGGQWEWDSAAPVGVALAAGLLLAVWVAYGARPSYAVYTWGGIAFFLSDPAPARPLSSDPRFLVVIFPLVWPLARLGRRPGWHEAVVALSAASMAIVAWLFLSTTLVF